MAGAAAAQLRRLDLKRGLRTHPRAAPDKVQMHLNFDFSAVQILWTLTFAAVLVLLVVLLGRDRARFYPWFTASITLIGLRLLSSRLLYGRVAPIPMNEIFLTLALIAGVVNLLVLVELARRAFIGASRRAWIIGTLILLAASGAVLAFWGAWPAWKTLTIDSVIAGLRLEQLITQKLDLLVDMLSIGLGLLIVIFGRRFAAGFRSHTQQIIIGLSTAALAQTAVRAIWQVIASHAAPTSQAEYQRILGLQAKLYNASSVIFVLALIWWIVCLWINEPGTGTAAAAQSTLTEETIIAPNPSLENQGE
jgi:hypothetical protein